MIIDYILIFFIKIFQYFLMILPERLQFALGRGIGHLIFFLLRDRRRVALSNIKRVFTDYTEKEVLATAKRYFEKLGVNVVELLLMPFMDDEEIHRRFSLQGGQYASEAMGKGGGMILLTYHFANWEVAGVASKLLKENVVALARPLKRRALLNEFINNLRRAAGLTVIVNENTASTVMRLLKENRAIAILADQREKRSRGVLVELFGTEVPTSKGVVLIAMKTGAPVVPIYAVRNGFMRYTFVCEAPIEMERQGDDKEELVRRNARKVNEFLEYLILKYPDEWFWVHRRWGRKERRRLRNAGV